MCSSVEDEETEVIVALLTIGCGSTHNLYTFGSKMHRVCVAQQSNVKLSFLFVHCTCLSVYSKWYLICSVMLSMFGMEFCILLT